MQAFTRCKVCHVTLQETFRTTQTPGLILQNVISAFHCKLLCLHHPQRQWMFRNYVIKSVCTVPRWNSSSSLRFMLWRKSTGSVNNKHYITMYIHLSAVVQFTIEGWCAKLEQPLNSWCLTWSNKAMMMILCCAHVVRCPHRSHWAVHRFLQISFGVNDQRRCHMWGITSDGGTHVAHARLQTQQHTLIK